MNNDFLINEEWVAIRDFPHISALNASCCKNDGERFEIKWNEDERLIEISCIKCEHENGGGDTWKHNISFSVEGLVANHVQLQNLLPNFETELPEMPSEPSGIWGYLSSSVIPDNFEDNVSSYLQAVEGVLGEKLFLEMYIQKSTSDEEYLENLNDLNRIALLDDVHNARDLLAEVRCLRSSSINLLDTLSIYTLEDEAQVSVDIANATLYNFERQPFIELREVARQKYRTLEKELSATGDDDKRQLELTTECFEWHSQLKDNEICLSDLQLNYFEKCCANLRAACDLMVDDQKTYGEEFGESVGLQRLNKKRKELFEQTVQLLLLKKKKLILNRETIKEKVCQLGNNENFERELATLEKKFYQAQLAVFEVQFDIISEEEKQQRLELSEYKDVECEPDIGSKADENESDDNGEDIFHDCVQDELLLEKTGSNLEKAGASTSNKREEALAIAIPETSTIINEFIGTPPTDEFVSTTEQDCGLFIRSNSLGHSPRRSLENKWAKRKISVDQLRKIGEPETSTDNSSVANTETTATTLNENKWETNENKWLPNGVTKCPTSSHHSLNDSFNSKWTENENRHFRTTNFDLMSTSTGSTCSLSEETTSSSLCRKNSTVSLESFTSVSKCTSSNSNSVSRVGRSKIPTVHTEEWYKKQEVLKLLNRTCRKRAWLRNKKRKFLVEWKEKVDKKKQMENYYKEHHAIQLKREKQQEEREQKKEMLEVERKKTLERLREHRKKYPDLVKRTPPRYNIPVRRTRNSSNNVPAFRPGGDPALITPDSPTALRISSDPDRVRKTQDSKNKKQATQPKLKRKNSKVSKPAAQQQLVSPTPADPTPHPPPKEAHKPTDLNDNEITPEKIDIVAEEIDNAVMVDSPQAMQPIAAAPPPPPPPPPPSFQQPTPPTTLDLISERRRERPVTLFPIPPKLKPTPQPSPMERKGLDLSGIISARLRLKKTTTVHYNDRVKSDDYALTDITASMLMNALNKMKKYTSDSTDDEKESDDLFD